MKRRIFSCLVGAAIMAHPLVSSAQAPARTPRIGFLAWGGCPDASSAFGRGLADLGRVWGKSVEVLCRSAGGDQAKLGAAAGDLVALNVDVIAALTHVTAYAAREATRSIPIVMVASGDPVRSDLVASLNRPGGNVTGLTYYALELVEKRLQLLKEIVPGATRVAVLANPDSDHVFGVYRQDAARAARALGLEVVRVEASSPNDLEQAFDRLSANRADALLVLTDPMLSAEATRIAQLAARHRIPAMYWATWFVEAGGLAAYSADYDAMMRRAAYYVDRLLKGSRPADLPVEQPTKFGLVVNLRAARAIGIVIPEALLARADELIE